MILICTSDSHGHNEILNKIYEQHKDADLFLDAGDSERREAELAPFLTVRGNCDSAIEVSSRIVKFGPMHIYLFHGHKALLSLESLAQMAKRNNCQMIIHGHTHQPFYQIYDGVHIICPGSVAIPRSREGATYAFVTLNGEDVKVEFKKVKQ